MRGLPGWLTELGNTGNGLFVVDRAQRILVWNRVAEQLLGHSAHDVVGRRCRDVIGAMERSGACCCGADCQVLRAVDARAPVCDFDARVRTKSGADVWVTFSVLALALPDNPLALHLFHPVRHRDHAKTLALADGDGRRVAALTALSSRERSILDCLTQGKLTSEIAADLGISQLTVRTHVRNMLTKARVRSRMQLVLLALRERGD
jgi:PAS domain S-box-containing protein